MTLTYATPPNPIELTTMEYTLMENSLFQQTAPLYQAAQSSSLFQTLQSLYQEMGFPSQKLEAYKYVPTTSMGRLHTTPAPQLETVNMPISWQLSPDLAQARTLVFINGVMSPIESTLISDPIEGVSLTPWKNTLPEDGLIEASQSSTDAMERLSLATLSDGLTLTVSSDVSVQPVIHVLFVEQADDTACQTTDKASNQTSGQDTPQQEQPLTPPPKVSYSAGRLHINAQEGSQAHVMVHTLATTPAATMANHSIQLNAKSNSQVHLTLNQHTVSNHWQFMAAHAHVEEHACATLTTLGTGHGHNRLHLSAHIHGSSAHLEHNGTTVMSQQGRQWLHSEIHHHAPEATSNQHVKALLQDQSRHDFDAVIVVDQPAQLTDAKQLNNNLLLSDSARAYARPQLRIHADDVKCAHGATVGQLDDDALFYMQSRGLNTELAQCLLTYGFASEPMQKVASPLIKQWTNQHLLVALGQQESPMGCLMDCNTCHGDEE